jgi:alpha-tubulin suppressor-like RCC1 family protein
MNIVKIISQLQTILASSTDTQTSMIIAKSIEKLKVGSIRVISSNSELPSLPLDKDGYLYLNETLYDLYYNVGSEWRVFPLTISGVSYSWGYNGQGRLGDGTTTSRLSPVTIIGVTPGWTEVSGGGSHSLGIASGIAYAWGNGGVGQLGIGSSVVSRSSPVAVIGGITNWANVSAGGNHSLGIAGGVAYGWGQNDVGQVGDGTFSSAATSPVTVVGGITDWSRVSAGSQFSLGLTESGNIYSWGAGSNGQLADGFFSFSRRSPVSIVGGITGWTFVSAGDSHALAISNGIAYAWGTGTYGRLGDNDVSNRASPVTVVGGITNWSQLSGGGNHSLGLTADGVLYAWGRNNAGQLGNNSTTDVSSPVTVVGGITNWSNMSGGLSHSLASTTSGIAYAWGSGFNGRLGDGTTVSKSSPITILGSIATWTSVEAGTSHSLGIIDKIITV